jgi:hypothetical protein
MKSGKDLPFSLGITSDKCSCILSHDYTSLWESVLRNTTVFLGEKENEHAVDTSFDDDLREEILNSEMSWIRLGGIKFQIFRKLVGSD